jgi:hypothetical protein
MSIASKVKREKMPRKMLLKSLFAATLAVGLSARPALALQSIVFGQVVEGPFTYTDPNSGASVNLEVVGSGEPQFNSFTSTITPAGSVINPGSWTQIQADAQSLGGNLVTVASAAENAFIVSTILQNFTGSGGPDLSHLPLWIGLSDPSFDLGGGSHAGNFVWADGSSSAYRNWNAGTGEPNDDPVSGNGNPNGALNFAGGGNGEYYTAINWHYAQGGGPQGTWNDTPDDGTLAFGGNSDGPYYGIAEVPVTASVPQPASWAMGLLGIALTASALRFRRKSILA